MIDVVVVAFVVIVVVGIIFCSKVITKVAFGKDVGPKVGKEKKEEEIEEKVTHF